jgi:hypothetical protein
MVFWVRAARHLPLASGVFSFQALHVPPPPTSPSGAGDDIVVRGSVGIRHGASFGRRGYEHSADDQDHK